MSRHEISKVRLDEIIKKVPDLKPLWNKIKVLNPDIISMKFGHLSRVPHASVCLNDSLSALGEATYALRESFAHEVWYKEEAEYTNETTANYFIRYYADDVALRLYSASEHLANAIIDFLPIGKKSFLRHQKKLSSIQSTVGKYLMRQRPKLPISISISELVKNSAWTETITYRNNWVHSQPPLVSGLGVQWLRKTRWSEVIKDGIVTGHRIDLGGLGDKPSYSPQQLRSIVAQALVAFLNTFECVSDFYIAVLVKNGIIIDGSKVSVKLK